MGNQNDDQNSNMAPMRGLKGAIFCIFDDLLAGKEISAVAQEHGVPLTFVLDVQRCYIDEEPSCGEPYLPCEPASAARGTSVACTDNDGVAVLSR